MNRTVSFLIGLAFSAAALSVGAAAQNGPSYRTAGDPQIVYATFYPGQSSARLQYVDWDDRHRCDGDHDRDDRNCHWRDRDGYYHGYGYVGHGYVYGPSNGAYYGPNGSYDQPGRWHTANGWYDKHGKWHKGREHDER